MQRNLLNDQVEPLSTGEIENSGNPIIQRLIAEEFYIIPDDIYDSPSMVKDLGRGGRLVLQFGETPTDVSEQKKLDESDVTARLASLDDKEATTASVLPQLFKEKMAEINRSQAAENSYQQIDVAYRQQVMYMATHPVSKMLALATERSEQTSNLKVKNENALVTVTIPSDEKAPIKAKIESSDFQIYAPDSKGHEATLAVIKGKLIIEAELQEVSEKKLKEIIERRQLAVKKGLEIYEKSAAFKMLYEKNPKYASALLKRQKKQKLIDVSKLEDLPKYFFKITSIKPSNPLLREILTSDYFPDFTQDKYKDYVVYPTLEDHKADYLARNKEEKPSESQINAAAASMHATAQQHLSQLQKIRNKPQQANVVPAASQPSPAKKTKRPFGITLKINAWRVLSVVVAVVTVVCALTLLSLLSPVITPAGAAGVATVFAVGGIGVTAWCGLQADNAERNYRISQRSVVSDPVVDAQDAIVAASAEPTISNAPRATKGRTASFEPANPSATRGHGSFDKRKKSNDLSEPLLLNEVQSSASRRHTRSSSDDDQ